MKKNLRRYVSKSAAKKDMRRMNKDQPKKTKKTTAPRKGRTRYQRKKVQRPPSPDIRQSLVFSHPKGSYPRLVLAGNSNVGKSSLARRILSNPALYKAKIGKTPGSTIKLNLVFDQNQQFHLVDLPGLGTMVRFSRKEQSFVQKQIVDYFEKDKENIFITLVVANILRIEDEISKWHDNNPNTIPLTFEFIQFLEELQIPCILVLNKIDKMSKIHLDKIEQRIRKVLDQLNITIKNSVTAPGLHEICYVSAKNGTGLRDLKQLILDRYKAFAVEFEKIHGPISELGRDVQDLDEESPGNTTQDAGNLKRIKKSDRLDIEEDFDDEDFDDEDFDDEGFDDEDFDDEDFDDEDFDDEDFDDEDFDDEDFDDEDFDDEDFDDEDFDDEDFDDDGYDDDELELVDEVEFEDKQSDPANKPTKRLDIVSIRRQKIQIAKKREDIIKDLKKKGYSTNFIKNYLANMEFKRKADLKLKPQRKPKKKTKRKF